MKKFQTLKALFEQDSADTPKIKIKITGTTTAPDERTAIKWTYQYGWPLDQPNLGSIQEFAEAFAESTEKDAQDVKNAIARSDQGGVVGISRDPGNSVNKRLFGKDLAEAVGFIYLLNPNIISQTLVPANKQLKKIAGRFTFIVDKDIKNYLAEINQEDDEIPSNTQNALSTNDGSSAITAAAFLQADGDAYSWYNASPNIIKTYVAPIQNKIGSSRITIEQSGPIVSIFWSFIDKLPGGLSVSAPAGLANTTFDENLQNAIKALLKKASEYDETYSPDAHNINILNRNLFATLVEALIIIGLNNSITATNVENEVLPASYKAPLEAALAAANGISGSASSSSSNATNQASSATAGFDGTAINTEMDLAKVLSGVFITNWNVAKADVDSLDKVKSMLNATAKSSKWPTPDKAWEETVKSLPWKKDSTPTSPWFIRTQYLTIKKNGTYGPKTTAGFANGFKASAF